MILQRIMLVLLLVVDMGGGSPISFLAMLGVWVVNIIYVYKYF